MRRYFLICLTFAFAVGCGGGLPDDVKPEQAGPHLRTALEAWKAGKPREELQSQSPSIVMNEDDWSAGSVLIEYKMDDAGRLDGRQVKWVAQIKFKDKNGKVFDRKATYIIDTIPRIVIVRDSFAT